MEDSPPDAQGTPREALVSDPLRMFLILEAPNERVAARLRKAAIESMNWFAVDLSRQRGPMLRQLARGD